MKKPFKFVTATFTEKHTALAEYLARHDGDVQSQVFDLIAELREGEVDFAAEGQAALGGEASPMMETIGMLTIQLMELEMAADRGP